MIKISDRFYISANTNCYTLQEKTTIKDQNSRNYGQEVFKDLGYFTSIEGCLKGVLKISTREYISKNVENSIEDLILEIKIIEESLEKLKIDV